MIIIFESQKHNLTQSPNPVEARREKIHFSMFLFLKGYLKVDNKLYIIIELENQYVLKKKRLFFHQCFGKWLVMKAEMLVLLH